MTDERPCHGCGNIDRDGRAHVYGERKCCPDCDHRVPQLSLSERIVVAHFENGEAAPESWVRQHVSEESCWCGPVQVGTLGVWTHRVDEP